MSTLINGAVSYISSACSYVFSAKKTENQYVKDLSEAYEALEAHAMEVFPLLMDSVEGSPFTRLENAIELLQSEGFILDTDLINRYREALKAYEDNFPGFLDANPSAGAADFRKAHLENQERKDRLAQGTDTEVGAYANLLDQREKLRLAFQRRSDEKVHSSDIRELSKRDDLSPSLREACDRYVAAEARYEEQFDSWFAEQENVTTRVLLKQAQDEVASPGEEAFVWRGRLEILEKRVEQLDRVVQEGFTALYDAYKPSLQDEISVLRDRLTALDPALVEKSRWGDSSWKIVKLFTWIGNAYSGWQNREEADELKRRYTALQSEAAAPKPVNEEQVRQWLDARPGVESLLSSGRKANLEGLRTRYLADVQPHLKHESLESVVSGTDANLSKEQELRMLYQSLKAKNPALKDKENERIEYNENMQTLYVTGAGEEYMVVIGNEAQTSARSSILRTLMENDPEGAISTLLRDKIIPPNIVGYVRWKDSSKRELLYARPQVATFHNVGDEGDKDLERSKIIAGDRLVLETTQDGRVKFEEGAIRLGVFVSDYDKALEKAPGLVRAAALPILQRSYPNGTKVTLNLTEMSVGVENGERKAEMDYSLNEEKKVHLEHGDEFNATLTRLAKNNDIGHYKSLQELRANFSEIQWEPA